ncbi:MAG: DNA cytosine methyltransferase [Lachnospiraceae bacterium]
MTFLDLFAGIGGFRRGLERSGHTCVGHVELDKYANRCYMAMYELMDCPYGELSPNTCRMCKMEVRENCDGKTCRGEWYGKDIKQITSGEIPRAEIWTFGFPCTDISVSGRMAGLHGSRSGLFFTVTGLIKSLPAKDKPLILVAENVKHLVHSQKGGDFTAVLTELWEAGYDCEWQVVNSKDFGVPQHRERVYLIGYLRGRGSGEVFPVGGANPAAPHQLAGYSQGMRIYKGDGLSVTLNATGGGFGGRTGLYTVPSKKGCAAFIDMNESGRFTAYARCIKAKQNAGVVRHKGETSGVFVCQGRTESVRAIINPDKEQVYQNGRRIKADGEPAFTITCQDRHGIVLCCCINQELTMDRGQPFVCCRVRRLTPRECWRLQAFEDELFDRAKAAGMSDSQLYKQAGNAVTVNIVYEIGLRLGAYVYGL